MTTDSTGHADTGNAQMYVGAKYTLTETKAAEGYAINSDSKTFEFKFTGNSVSYSKLNIDVGNDSQKGKISVYKSGDAFTGVTAMEAPYPLTRTAKSWKAVRPHTSLCLRNVLLVERYFR